MKSEPPGTATPSRKQQHQASAQQPTALLSPAALGLRIKALRRDKQLTVEALADLVGVHKTHVSRIERGLKAPSLTMIGKLAEALDASVGHLVGEVIHEDAIVVNRSADIVPRFTADEQHQFTPLFESHRNGNFGAFVLYPGTSDGPIQAQHEGHEMIYVLSGAMDIHFQDRTERLQAGDCIHFPGYLVHRVVRVGRAKATALLVISPS